ncbi:MAG: transglycosylase SLT domain-containing protein [Bdellovibrionota bacterium]
MQRTLLRQGLLCAALLACVHSSAATNTILKPETLKQLIKKLGYKDLDTGLGEYLLFSERIQQGFATSDWIESCKKERNRSLCMVIEDYFEFANRSKKKKSRKEAVKRLGRLSIKKVSKYQAESFQSLLNALPSKDTKFLLSYANETAKKSTCPQNLSLALAYELEPLAGSKKHFPLIEKLYKNGIACADPKDTSFELGNLRLGLIYTALGKEDEAIPFFKKALDAEFPREDYRSIYWLAHLLRKKNPAEAEKYLNSMLEKYPLSWYSIVLLHEKGLDPMKMNLRSSDAPDVYTTSDKKTDIKFSWMKLGLLLEKDPYKLKKYAEYIADQITPDIEYGYIQHMSRLFHAADLYKAQITILTRFSILSKAALTEEALGYLYPAPYLELFNLHGVELDTAIIIGLARQESAFDVNAKSSANAQGLLQMLPSTARHMGAKSSKKLWSPSENIRFASKFLIRLAKRFDNSIEKAMAAYNAGPSRVEQWEKDFGWIKDPELFVDMIPYRETRDYVPTILRNAYWYHRVYPGTLNITKKEYVTSGLLKPLISKFK